MKDNKKVETLENTNLKEALESINEKYNEEYKIISQKRKIRFKTPFSLVKDYTFHLELNEKQKRKQTLITNLRAAKEVRLRKKEKLLTVLPFVSDFKSLEAIGSSELNEEKVENQTFDETSLREGNQEKIEILKYLQDVGLSTEFSSSMYDMAKYYVRRENETLKDIIERELLTNSLTKLYGLSKKIS